MQSSVSAAPNDRYPTLLTANINGCTVGQYANFPLQGFENFRGSVTLTN